MTDVRETIWAKETKYDNNTVVRRKKGKYFVLDLLLTAGGAAAMFGIGSIGGEILDHVPYVKDWIPYAIDAITGIDVHGNLDGLVGLIAGFYGLKESGVKINKETLKLEKMAATPIHFYPEDLEEKPETF